MSCSMTKMYTLVLSISIIYKHNIFLRRINHDKLSIILYMYIICNALVIV